MGCPIPQCGRFESFPVSRGALPGTSVVPTTSTSSVTLWLCVVVCLAAMRGTACTSHPPKNKNSLAVTPIYHFHFNLYFLKAPLALRWSQAPRHSVTSHAPACAPHVIFYFPCLLESLLDFRFAACRFCATEAATGAFPLLWAKWLPHPCRLGDAHRFRAGGQNQKWPTCGQNGYLTPAVSGIPTASERGDKIRSGPLVGEMATSPLPSRGSPPLQCGGTKSEVAHLWAKWLPHPCRLGDPHRFRAGGQNQKWPTCGRNGYLTPAVWGIPTASERGDKIRSGQNGYLTPAVSGIPTAS